MTLKELQIKVLELMQLKDNGKLSPFKNTPHIRGILTSMNDPSVPLVLHIRP